jgi:hypothetical protein
MAQYLSEKDDEIELEIDRNLAHRLLAGMQQQYLLEVINLFENKSEI